MSWALKACVAVAVFTSLLFTSTAEAARGRPYRNAAGTTFVADNGQLMRGPFVSTEWSGPPTLAQMTALKDLGFNAVHLYGEVFDPNYPNPGSQSPGYAMARIDQMVQMTRDLGLYLIITIGNGANNGTFNGQYINDFWTIYAPRYKDETHVLYEIQNEPHAWSAPYPQAAIDMEASAYTLIRSHAPNTPILLMTFAVLGDGPAAVTDIQKVATAASIDWTRTGIAVHGYAGPAQTRASIQYIVNAGYPCFMTEFYSVPWGTGVHTVHADPEMTADMERLKISWLSFHHTPNEVFTPWRYTEVIERAGLSWVPDYGTWPPQRGVYNNGGEPRATTGLSGTLRIEAEHFDTGGQGVAYNDADSGNTGGAFRTSEGVDIEPTSDTGAGYDVGWTAAGEWIEYTVFVTEPGKIDLGLRVASPSGGTIRVYLNGQDKTGALTVPNTGGWQTWTTLTPSVNLEFGRQKIRVEFVTGGFNLNWIELKAASAGAVANGTYKLVNRNSGKAMQGDTASGKVLQYPFNGSTLQQWTLQHLGASQYSVRSVNNNWSWSVFYGSNGDPLDFVAWYNVGSPYQRYIVTPVGDGYVRVAPVSSGVSLETQQASLADGARVQQYGYAGNAHQQWAVQAPTAPAIPTGLTAVQSSSTRVDLTWTGASGATSYNVKRATTAGGPYTTIASGIGTTSYGDTTVTSGVSYYYVVSANSAAGESLNSAEARPDKLHAHLAFNESSGATTAADSTGNGWTGTLVNGPLWTTGKFGNAIDLDGTDDHVTLPTGVVSSLTEITVATWVYLDAASTWSRVFDFGTSTSNYMFLTPRNGISGTVRFAITSGSGEQVINGAAQLPTGVWTHVAVTLKGSTGILYVNGAQAGRNDSMTLSPIALGSTTQNYIGKSQWADPYLNGRVDDFRIYSSAMSAAAVAALAAESPSGPPLAPSNLTASPVSNTQINLAWTDNSTNESGFKVERATSSGGPWTEIGTAGANASTFSSTGLTGNTTYYYRVRAYVSGTGDHSGYSNVASARTLANPPAAPSNLAVKTVSSSRLDLTWRDNSSIESGTKIERSPDGINGWTQIATVGRNVKSYSNTGLAAGTTYFYRVRAYNADGVNSGYSNTASGTTSGSSASTGTAPNAPGGLTATASSSTRIDLAWADNSADESGFKIERSSNGGSTWSQITTVSANVTSYGSSSLWGGTTYHYRVRAYNGSGDSGYSNTASALTKPVAPSTPTIQALAGRQLKLSWGNVSGETGYSVERSLDGSSWSQRATTGANATSFTDSGLTAGTRYYYRVRAYNGSGFGNYTSAVSAIAID